METINLKDGLPTQEQARSRLRDELHKARQRGTSALKIIHGYGSSGAGGVLRHALRASLRKSAKNGEIRGFIAGEDWQIFNVAAQAALRDHPELEKDPDLNRYNEGITIILL